MGVWLDPKSRSGLDSEKMEGELRERSDQTRPLKVKEAVSLEHCCNTSRNSISFSQLPPHCLVVDIERWKLGEGQSGPSPPARWPWVPQRHKSVGAGQHSSEQVNRGPLIPPGALGLLQLNGGFSNVDILQTRTVWHRGKQNSPFLRAFCKWQVSSFPFPATFTQELLRRKEKKPQGSLDTTPLPPSPVNSRLAENTRRSERILNLQRHLEWKSHVSAMSLLWASTSDLKCFVTSMSPTWWILED